ncbi:MAG: pentapeptide repeat-containing protein [Myxococcaceae bacterium]|nr:pentapeptide repeat-containing protein [Myxococcaceae bacterium]
MRQLALGGRAVELGDLPRRHRRVGPGELQPVPDAAPARLLPLSARGVVPRLHRAHLRRQPGRPGGRQREVPRAVRGGAPVHHARVLVGGVAVGGPRGRRVDRRQLVHLEQLAQQLPARPGAGLLLQQLALQRGPLELGDVPRRLGCLGPGELQPVPDAARARLLRRLTPSATATQAVQCGHGTARRSEGDEPATQRAAGRPFPLPGSPRLAGALDAAGPWRRELPHPRARVQRARHAALPQEWRLRALRAHLPDGGAGGDRRRPGDERVDADALRAPVRRHRGLRAAAEDPAIRRGHPAVHRPQGRPGLQRHPRGAAARGSGDQLRQRGLLELRAQPGAVGGRAGERGRPLGHRDPAGRSPAHREPRRLQGVGRDRLSPRLGPSLRCRVALGGPHVDSRPLRRRAHHRARPLRLQLRRHRWSRRCRPHRGRRRRRRSARLRSARLRSARLRSARLRSARLRSARLRSARLRSARLRPARLRSARLRSARLRSARLRSARLRSARLRSA